MAREPACVHACAFSSTFTHTCDFLLYLLQGINLVSRAWPVINFYSSAPCALALTTSNYVAGRPCRRKESHTFGWYESLPFYYSRPHRGGFSCQPDFEFLGGIYSEVW